MPFDPLLPQENTLIDAVQMRAQLNSLKSLIDAVPGITDVVIDGVTTLPPGSAATVTAVVIGTVLHLSFEIPAGNEGPDGPQGPPFATVVVDAVNTLAPGEAATVTATFDGATVHLVFGIPAGQQGQQGEQGPPGEVTAAQLADAVGTATSATLNASSANSNAVATLDVSFADPDAESMRLRFNELVLALRRL